ncbi:hypothetical protein TOPH_08625 [Tolypocladium ophioglossoides CBS 100239]|uniref:PD-(D/E)XK nuclease-like domain-containing protein n=1 Tax=Tolypocladium ophioglossoides (strain CBS 100239) TaxID=1163406 RepID=A0A0L0MY25_TOLOC|nr:hypothetical protein TOPH_08625 [Tolypocladium ophioglossoides CBS 100239]
MALAKASRDFPPGVIKSESEWVRADAGMTNRAILVTRSTSPSPTRSHLSVGIAPVSLNYEIFNHFPSSERPLIMSVQHRISSWLASISAPGVAEAPCPIEARPRKRVRQEARSNVDGLTRVASPFNDARESGALIHLSTPSVSASSPPNFPQQHRLAMSSSPSKRRRDEDLEDSYSVASSSSYYPSSSRHPGPSRSSPTKQIRHAGLQRTGFRQASFEFDPQPPSLQSLCQSLRLIHYGDGILPTRLKTEFADIKLPGFFFHDDPNTAARRYPDRSFVRSLLSQANECDLDGKGESSWNMDVHARILAWLLEDDSTDDACLGSEYCTTAGLLREYKPNGAPSKMIDFCLAIRPRRSEDQDIIDDIRSQRPGDSINHTDWGSLSKYPIAISIETKRHGEQYDAALLQIATWHSAQWRSLRWGRQEEVDRLLTVEFLSGLIVQGHDWQFVPSILGKDAVSKVVRPPLQIGDTRTETGILKLFPSLQELKQDAEKRFWPAFKVDVLINGTPC